MYRFGANDPVILPSKRDWADNNPKWTETPLYPAEALRARDERIAELENLAKANNDLARIEAAYRKQLAFQRAEMATALEAVTSQYGDRLPAQFLADITAMLMRPALRSVALKEKIDVA
jgi:hypothetical protein